VNEHAEQLPAQQERQGEGEKPSPQELTQRELVRASLLKCPPAPPAQSPRR